MSESFAELFEQSIKDSNVKPGELITGQVIQVTPDVVIVNAGLKSEAAIPVSQFKDGAGHLNVAVGDEVEVVLESLENGFGETQMSREKAMRVKAWDVLEKAFEDQSIVTGYMTGKVKGGFTISIDSIRAFLPASLVDVRPVRDPAYLEGKELEFKVIKIDRKRNNVVVSRRAVVETEMSADREELLANL
ncbi:MAG: S1 RNA-binding domain-containing protein, partial [Acidiferrobacterales bacterium]|nr:S1 RNA-binding domain-containing protein [Acidiferrobacterales bacterium]